MTFYRSFRRAAGALLISSMLAVSGGSAFAQQEISPEHLDLAREYIDLSDRARIYEQHIARVGANAMRLLTQQNPDMSDAASEVVASLAEEYVADKSDLFDQFARIYANRFSIEELQEIVDFYTTDVGQKLLDQNRSINQDLQRVLEVWQRNVSREFLARARADLREQGFDL